MFVDTNVLVYATQATALQHAAAKAKLDSLHADGVALCVSLQVLREYLAVVTRPQLLAAPLPIATALARLSSSPPRSPRRVSSRAATITRPYCARTAPRAQSRSGSHALLGPGGRGAAL